MSYSCPVTFVQIDTNVSRFNSLFVSSLVVAYLGSSNVFILYFLALDFLIKLYINKKYSPLYILSRLMKKSLGLKNNFTDGGAKRLAAYFGLLFMLLLIITHLFNLWILSLLVAAFYLSCALLDVVLNYCLGCKVYFIIKKIYPHFMN
ncbi:DUF4395 domain-containing protein [bacterium]|nr:DUF4395 domain-containing protein [bacterium]MBU1994763.1 DUF4395 domain-containing protein [bacterium]